MRSLLMLVPLLAFCAISVSSLPQFYIESKANCQPNIGDPIMGVTVSSATSSQLSLSITDLNGNSVTSYDPSTPYAITLTLGSASHYLISASSGGLVDSDPAVVTPNSNQLLNCPNAALGVIGSVNAVSTANLDWLSPSSPQGSVVITVSASTGPGTSVVQTSITLAENVAQPTSTPSSTPSPIIAATNTPNNPIIAATNIPTNNKTHAKK